MKLLLDESLPRKLKEELIDHEAVTVPDVGWAGKKNGELFRLARDEFDAFTTPDQNLKYQQRINPDDLPVVVLVANSNRFNDLLPLAPDLLSQLGQVRQGEVVHVVAS